jgi:hypothetical protein
VAIKTAATSIPLTTKKALVRGSLEYVFQPTLTLTRLKVRSARGKNGGMSRRYHRIF